MAGCIGPRGNCSGINYLGNTGKKYLKCYVKPYVDIVVILPQIL